jgi:hypothetical protein
VYCVPANMSTLEALSQMARDHKSSLGVTDPASGQLIGNLSVSDLRWVGGWVAHGCGFMSVRLFDAGGGVIMGGFFGGGKTISRPRVTDPE